MIKDFYRDKTLLITGGTGFLGKVVLEKFFRCHSDIKRMYLLVRPKKGVLIMDRVKREIFQSQCFDAVRKMPHFEELINEKIVPIEGDITKENLAMRPEDRQRLMNELQVIINCAASVDFNERLCDAININYMGCLRMLDLAHNCRNIQVFTHVSTAYTNCEKKGFIKEQIYEISEDSEELINRIRQMTPEEQDLRLKEILGPWPNTYTYTKSMAERTLKKKRRPDLPVVLLRPAIIISAVKEPLYGWTDTLSAAGGLSLAGGIGIMNQIHGNKNNIADLVPVDYVSNCIIASTALKARKPELTVIHSATSHIHPITWYQFMEYVFSHLKHQPFELQAFQPQVNFIENPKWFKVAFFMRKDLPIKVLDKISKIPGIGSAQMRKNIEKAKKINARSWELGMMFDHFTVNQWIYESNMIYDLLRQMTAEEKKEYDFDPRNIDWPSTIRRYAYGIQKYVMKQEVVLPDQEQATLVRKNDFEYFEDVRWAFFDGQPILTQNLESIRKDVLNSSILQRFIQKSLQNQGAGKSTDSQLYQSLMNQADKHLKDIEAQLKPSVVRPTLWFFQKIWNKVYNQIIVNVSQLKELKTLLQDKSINVILTPTHKSYMDFILLGFIHYHFKLDYPFVCGDDALFSLAIISYLIKSTNGFYANSQSMKGQLYQAVIESYIFALMKHNCLIELFLEQRRSRTGKIKRPTEELFDHILKVFLEEIDGHDLEKKDIVFVPVTINYDRIHEGESFPLELLGESPTQESLVKILRQFTVVNRSLGKVNIKYCQPLSLKDYMGKHSQRFNIDLKDYKADKKVQQKLIVDLGRELSYQQVENLVIMSTPMVATVLLMHRKGISQDLLIKRVVWLYEEIKARNGDLNLSSPPSSAIINQCLTFLSGFVDRKRDIFEPSVSAKKGQKNILMLTYYRNNLSHLFLNDAEISCSILGFNSTIDISKGVELENLWNRVRYLRDLLSDEFVIRKTVRNVDDFLVRLKLLQQRDCLTLDLNEKKLYVDPTHDNHQYANSFLYHMLLPFIETYWMTLAFFIPGDNRKASHEEEMLYNKIQWLIETFYGNGIVKIYESCMLESIKNAVQKYFQMGVLSRSTITQKRVVKSYIKVSDAFLNDDKFIEQYEQVMFYLPYSPNMDFHRIQSEIRKVMISDIQLSSKL